jgi:predicted protein tyrosine phosphatase
VRKLWTARVLVLLSAVALGAVVIDERREQERESEQLQRISVPAAPGHVIDVRDDGTSRPRPLSTTLYLRRSAEPRAHPGSR